MSVKIGNYEVIKQIGEGGFSRVYLAKHSLLDEYACIKQNIELSDEDKELLKREAKLLWKIHHHSLPTLRDYFVAPDGSCVMVMTFVKGKDLFAIVEKDYPTGLDPEHVCWITQRLLNALHYLHFHGVIHGDIKPQNILINPEEHNAILVDYGLSAIKPKSMTKPIGYTAAFSAPEQIAGKPPIPETDIYGLGVSMIYSLGGNFSAMTFPDSVPKPIKEFFSSMVLRDPFKRPNSAESLIKPLSELRTKVFGRSSSGKELKLS
jgi:serine/threonine-protein kinase